MQEQLSPALIIYQFLLDSLPGEDRVKTAAKLRRKLARSRFGYDQQQVDHVSNLHAQLIAEIKKFRGSKYYRGPVGTFASPEDFDMEAMTSDFHASYSQFSIDDVQAMVRYAVHYYYVR